MDIPITDLLDELVCRNLKDYGLTIRSSDYWQQKKYMKQSVYNNLFAYLKGPHKKSCYTVQPTSLLSVWHLFHQVTFESRRRRLFDKASELEDIFNSVIKEAERNADLLALLHFILLGAVPIKEEKKSLIGTAQNLPIVYRDIFLPPGPLNYSDTRMVVEFPLPYTHFPNEMFHTLNRPLAYCDLPDQVRRTLKIFKSRHPFTLCKGNFFTASLPINTSPNAPPCFMGAFTQGDKNAASSAGHLLLDIPDLEEHGPVAIRPKQLNFKDIDPEDMSEDEGFIGSCSGPGGTPDCLHHPEHMHRLPGFSHRDPLEDVVQFVLHPHPIRLTWETRGRPQLVERPFITEIGPEGVRRVVEATRQRAIRLRHAPGPPCLPPPPFPIRTESALLSDVITLRLGLSSTSFHRTRGYVCFHLYEDIVLAASGTTQGATSRLLESHVRAGTHYARLRHLAHWPTNKRPAWEIGAYQRADELGLVQRALATALGHVLDAYRASMLALAPHSASLIALTTRLHDSTQLLEFLASVFNVNMDEDNDDSSSSTETPASYSDISAKLDWTNRPKGLVLISYLHRYCLDCLGGPMYPVMVYLFQEACRPFFALLENWIFSGSFYDVHNEFMIAFNDEFLMRRDVRFWLKGFQLVGIHPGTNQQALPLFSPELTQAIFCCGKSLNLLRIVAPQHYLFRVRERSPGLRLTMSADAVLATGERTAAYVLHVQHTAWQRQATRQQQEMREEMAKRDLIRRAKETSIKEMDRLQGRIRAIREAADKRKRAELASLQAEAAAAAERRKQQKERDLEEERKDVIELQRRENELKAFDQDLEKKAREELVNYYSQLTGAAAYRELRALWRIQRHRYDSQRTDFLLRDEAHWRQEMEALKETNSPQISFQSMMDPSLSFMERRLNDTTIPVDSEPNSPPPVLDGIQKRKKWDRPSLPFTGDVADQPAEENATVEKARIGTKKQRKAWASPRESVTFASDVVFDTNNSALETVVTGNANNNALGDEGDDKSKEGTARSGPIRRAIEETDVNAVDEEDKQRLERYRAVNRHGHASDISAPEEENGLPRLQSDLPRRAIEESDLNALAEEEKERLESYRAVNRHGHASDISAPEDEQPRTHLRIPGQRRAIEETEESYVEARNREKLNRFRELNTFGHPSGEHRVGGEGTMETVEEMEEARVRGFRERNKFGHASDATLPRIWEEGSSTWEMERPLPRMSETLRMAIDETDFAALEEMDKARMDRFKALNRYGHSSDQSDPLNSQSNTNALVQLRSGLTSMHELVDRQGRRKIIGRARIETDMEAMEVAEQERLKRFKNRNIRGHSSDSTVQKLLYGADFGRTEQDDVVKEEEIVPSPLPALLIDSAGPDPFWCKFDIFDQVSSLDLMTNHRLQRPAVGADSSAVQTIPLPVLLDKLIVRPLEAQISLVNEALVNYFMVELQIESHFKAIRKFFFMEDGELTQTVLTQIFDKMTDCDSLEDVSSASFLSGVLFSALQHSRHVNSTFAERLSFARPGEADLAELKETMSFDFLALRYSVDWPTNLVITEQCMEKYNRVYAFLIQIKYAVWAMSDSFFHLRSCGWSVKKKEVVNKNLRELQLFRHEMEHLVKVLEGYVFRQVNHVTWIEFKADLKTKVTDLDALRRVHGEYLNRVLHRCLLVRDCGPAAKAVSGVLKQAVRFRRCLIGHAWPSHGRHPNYAGLKQCHTAFREHGRFLRRLIRGMVAAKSTGTRHLEELLLLLDMNGVYEEV